MNQSTFRESVGYILKIEWLDSGGRVEMWTFKDEELPKSHLCRSVGYLVSKNKNDTILAQSENDEQWGRLLVIPTKSIIRMEKL